MKHYTSVELLSNFRMTIPPNKTLTCVQVVFSLLLSRHRHQLVMTTAETNSVLKYWNHKGRNKSVII